MKWMFLTHRDDFADHVKFRERFGCERIIHVGDDVIGAERVITGTDVPGHGRPYRAASSDAAHADLAGLVSRMRAR